MKRIWRSLLCSRDFHWWRDGPLLESNIGGDRKERVPVCVCCGAFVVIRGGYGFGPQSARVCPAEWWPPPYPWPSLTEMWFERHEELGRDSVGGSDG